MKIIPHQHYVNARQELRQAVSIAQPGAIIFVIGPPGTGKTTVRRDVFRDCVGNPVHWGLGRLPAIEVFATLPQNAYFSSLSFARDLHEQIFAPSLRWLGIDTSDPLMRCLLNEIAEARKALQAIDRRPRSEGKVWEDFGRSAMERSLKWVCVDQASAMCINHRDKSAAEHILHLMSLGEKCGLVFVLCGTHKAAPLWETHSEVIRRSAVVWLPTYNHKRMQDRNPYLSILRTLSSKYTFKRPDLIGEMASELLYATAGSYGLIEKLFLTSSARASTNGHSSIHREDIEESYFGDRDLEQLWKDVEEFDTLRERTKLTNSAAEITKAWRMREKETRAKGATSSDNSDSE